MHDVLVIGGGVIGLSLAYELTGHRLAVRVIDRREPGRESSWAGAGILPPASQRDNAAPLEHFAALSNTLHARWADQLAQETGIDNGYRRCGAVYLASSDAEARELQVLQQSWQAGGVDCRWLNAADLRDLEPNLAPSTTLPLPLGKGRGEGLYALYAPEESQLRNPRHLRALLAACHQRGVQIDANVACEGFDVVGDRIIAVRTSAGQLAAKSFCVASGAWSRLVAEPLGMSLRIRPIRGQIVLFAGKSPLVSRIVNVGRRYLLPRDDGRILAGSTEEDVGFAPHTTEVAIEALTRFATDLVPSLKQATVERAWAGLRPGADHGLPYLGQVPGIANAFVAAGHYRQGLQLSTGTAIVVSALIRGEKPPVDLSAFRIDR
jgi:glycine oxidase